MTARLAALALIWLPAAAQAFTLPAPNPDWARTERYCSEWGAECTFSWVSNDTQPAAFDLGTLEVGGFLDTDTLDPGAYKFGVFGSDDVSLSHGSDLRFSDTTEYFFVYDHPVDGGLGFDVDTDWYLLEAADDQCVQVCISPASVYGDDALDFPDDWMLDVYDLGGTTLATATGLVGDLTCVDVVMPAGPIYLRVFDNTPDSAYPPWRYRLTIDNASGDVQALWYDDGDRDGYGDENDSGTLFCGTPEGNYAPTNDDCNDDKATGGAVHPFAQEVCNDADDDCDDEVDEDLPYQWWWPDDDLDDWGDEDATPLYLCGAPPDKEWVTQPHDCDDGVTAVNPEAKETCNEVDDDCDGLTDEGLGTAYWPDGDDDGFGDASAEPTLFCSDPGDGWSSVGGDCDDDAAGVHPDTLETCNLVDDDCDGTVDEGFDTTPWYPDDDGDGDGTSTCAPTEFCTDPGDGWSETNGDCDDHDAGVASTATEIPADGIDQDCDGNDECDADGDGYLSDATACGGTDCDDDDADVHPGAPDTWYDGVDSDCAGNDDYDQDADGHAEADHADEYDGDLPVDDCVDTDADQVSCPRIWAQSGVSCATGPAGAGPLGLLLIGLLALARRRRGWLVLGALLATPLVARAQGDGLSASGFAHTPSDNDLSDGIRTWRPETQVPWSVGAGLLFQYADSPLQLVRESDTGRETWTLLDNLVGAHLSVHAAFHERVAAAVSLPLWFTSTGPDGTSQGFSLGDLSLSVPVGIVLPDPEVGGFGLSVVPFVELPTGRDTAFLGSPGVGGGGYVVPGYQAGIFDVAANVGFRARPGLDYENLNGGSQLLFGLGAGVSLTEYMALRLEANLDPILKKNEVVWTESPAEATLTARGRYDLGLSWLLGGAVGLSRGVGAARYRIFFQLGWTFGKPLHPDTDGDGILDADDACVEEPETFNGYLDEEGCPDELGTVRVVVRDPEGHPAAGVPVVLGGQEVGTTDAEGVLVLSDQVPGADLALEVEPEAATAWAPAETSATVGEGDQTIELDLGWLPGAVRVITRTEQGAPVDAEVDFLGPQTHEPARIGEGGQRIFVLESGEWALFVSAEGFGTARRDLTIEPNQTSLVIVEIALEPPVVAITREEVVLLEQIQFDFDEATLTEASIPVLEEIGNNLLTHPDIAKVEIQGHTDSEGPRRYNQDLSQRRMETVVGYLVDRGVDADRLVPVGYGEDCPLESNATDAGRATNRRVQFIILDPPPEGGVPCHDGIPARRGEARKVQVEEAP